MTPRNGKDWMALWRGRGLRAVGGDRKYPSGRKPDRGLPPPINPR